jgi:hypothetical protein
MRNESRNRGAQFRKNTEAFFTKQLVKRLKTGTPGDSMAVKIPGKQYGTQVRASFKHIKHGLT